ncbi:helix-turn-helix transcriptional regulator [Mariniblastus sp.]|nr:helix-turn-helix transcriptional regulator [Mariniblastus sp.]
MSKDKRKEAIASRLKQARKASGLTQGQAAKRLKFHRPTISEIEAARRSVSAEEVAGFAELYGVDSYWIMEGSQSSSSEDDKIVLAARQLSKLKDNDLDRLMQLLQMLRGDGGKK